MKEIKALQIGFNPEYSEEAPSSNNLSSLDGKAILEFGAPWCPTCQRASLLIEEVLSGLSIPHIKIFDGKGKRLGREYKIKLWPTLILLYSGDELDRVIRPKNTESIQNLIR